MTGIQYPSIVQAVISNCEVKVPSILQRDSNFKKFRAIWDTGANTTVVNHNVIKELGLKPTGMTKMYSINDYYTVNTYLLDLALPMKVVFPNINVIGCEINTKDIDVVIGMDIIQAGDFSISNSAGKTLFSYCTPSHNEPVDLLEKSNIANTIAYSSVSSST